MHIAAMLPPEDLSVEGGNSTDVRWPPAYAYVTATTLRNFWVGQAEIDRFITTLGSPWIVYWTPITHERLEDLIGPIGLLSVYRYGSAPYVQATVVSEYRFGRYESVHRLFSTDVLTYVWLNSHPRQATLPSNRRVIQISLTEWAFEELMLDPATEVLDFFRRSPTFNK